MVTHLIDPHGGELVNLVADAQRGAELKAESHDWLTWDLTFRQTCDLELLLNGGFSPLRGFQTRADYEAVCASMRLADGTLWPIPVTLDVPEELVRKLGPSTILVLRDQEGLLLAALHVHDVWKPDRMVEAEAVYGTTSREHPGVADLIDGTHPYYVGGRLEGVQLPIHYDFRPLRSTPQELRVEFGRLGWPRVVAFQTRNPMHRAHHELTLRALKEIGAGLLLHPVVGMSKPGDVDHYTRVRCYQAILGRYPPSTAKLALLPLAMRLAGPREALWHAIIRKNHGCSHFIVGRDHAGPGRNSSGQPFYPPFAAQELVQEHVPELGIQIVKFTEMVYVEGLDTYLSEDEVPVGAQIRSLSGTDLRRRLVDGQDLPSWFTFPEVVQQLRRCYPPRRCQGFTVFLTGLAGAGKSTLARILEAKLLEAGGRSVTLLDGDRVRRVLSPELGFSKADRDLNIRRVGFVASEITKSGGIALCAPIAPYDSVRREVRSTIERWGGFVLVFVATPLEICEQRDRKGLYAKARAGFIQQFTGISDPYEPPADAEVVVDTTHLTPEESAQTILLYLEREGYVSRNL